jgi:sugar transferase (PEP-CTERM system associated)
MVRIGGQAIPHRTLLLIGREGALIFLALLMATLLRHPASTSPWVYVADPDVLWRLLAPVSICVISFYYHDLYDLQMVRSMAHTSVRVSRGLGIAMLVMAATCLFNPRLSPAQGVAVIAAPTIMLLMISSRVSLLSFGDRVGGAERVLVVGSGALGRKLIAELQHRPDFNYSVVGTLSESDDTGELSVPRLGSLSDIERVASEHQIDRIVVCLRERRGGMPTRELMRLKFNGVQIEDPYALYERITGRIVVENLSPSFFIFSDGFKTSRARRWVKRALDFVVALIGIVLTSPFMLLAAVAIFIEDGFPLLYRQDRVGLNAEPFKIIKFRSMRTSIDAKPSWTGDRDPRITRVGRYLRAFRLDELPQFLNILRGHMSLIGPRPEQPYFCNLLEEKIPYFSYRHTVRPGITGWAQIKYGYGATIEDARRKLELDLFYIKHLSMPLDLAIMFETAKVVLFGRGK